MAVPSIPQPRSGGVARVLRRPGALDVCVGLLAVLVLPLVLASLPNTVVVVAALLPADVSQVEMTRAYGLALPAMLLAVPLGALAVRRFRALPVLAGGLALLVATGAAGGYADSPPEVGVLRVLHGLGAGAAVAATLAAVWERGPAARRVLLPVWAVSLTAGLLAAQALALWPLDQVTSWQVMLRPYPVVTVAALVMAVAVLLLLRRAGAAAEPAALFARRPLVLAAALAAGVSGLALGASYGWAPPLLLAAGGVATVALLGLAAGGGEGRNAGFVMVAVGMVVLPTAAQLTNLELAGLGGPGLSSVWPTLAAAAVAALAAALGTAWLKEPATATVTACALGAVVAGLCAVRLLSPFSSSVLLAVPLVLLAVGAAVASTAVLRYGGLGAALFGVSLCFPAVIGGFLLGTGIQVSLLRAADALAGRSLAEELRSVLHWWALVSGFLVVVVLVLTRLRAGRRTAAGSGGPAAVTVAAAGPARAVPGTGAPLVPPPSPSPEDASSGEGGGRSAR